VMNRSQMSISLSSFLWILSKN